MERLASSIVVEKDDQKVCKVLCRKSPVLAGEVSGSPDPGTKRLSSRLPLDGRWLLGPHYEFRWVVEPLSEVKAAGICESVDVAVDTRGERRVVSRQRELSDFGRAVESGHRDGLGMSLSFGPAADDT